MLYTQTTLIFTRSMSPGTCSICCQSYPFLAWTQQPSLLCLKLSLLHPLSWPHPLLLLPQQLARVAWLHTHLKRNGFLWFTANTCDSENQIIVENFKISIGIYTLGHTRSSWATTTKIKIYKITIIIVASTMCLHRTILWTNLFTLYLIYVGWIYGTHHHLHRHVLGAYIANGVVL